MKLKSTKNYHSSQARHYRQFTLYAQSGFTLIEFMVAAILGLMILLAIGGAYVATQRVNETAATRVERQQELRLAGNILVRDARMSGTFGCANLSALEVTGLSVDHGGSGNLQLSNPSYFNVNESAGANRVFATRIVPANSAVMSTIDATFKVKSNTDIVIFNYGINTQPLLKSSLTGPNTLVDFTVADSSFFNKGTDVSAANARLILASCKRVDILRRNQLTINNNHVATLTGITNIPIYRTGANMKTIVTQTGALSGIGHHASQATISNLYTVVYAIGKVAGDNQADALYRFELQVDGSWSPPQLLSRNVSNLAAEYVYINNCKVTASPTSTTADASYFISKDAFLEKNNAAGDLEVLTPSGIQLKLTPSAVTTESEGNAVTTAQDLQVLVLRAAMRGADACTIS